MVKLVLASRNRGKLKELKALLNGRGFEVISLDSFEGLPEIPETGTTFKENAVIKAREAARMTGNICLADDSGLEVDYLHGAPGVFSSRFAGPQKDDSANNEKLLKLLEGVPREHRTARFKCVVAVASPDGYVVETVEGVCEGSIGFEPKGNHGFGYDPIFIVADKGCTMAELDPEIKNSISHRAKALKKAVPVLEAFKKKYAACSS